PGAALVAVTPAVAGLTLLPAVLSLLGDGVNALKIPLIGKSAEQGTAAEGRFWGAIVRGVMRQPALSLALSTALLVAFALPVLDYTVGEAGMRTMPDRVASKR